MSNFTVFLTKLSVLAVTAVAANSNFAPKTRRSVPICDLSLVPCLSDFARFFEFRFQVNVLDVYDRLTGRGAEINNALANQERALVQKFETKRENLKQKHELEMKVAQNEAELRQFRRQAALEHLRQLRRRLKSAHWRLERVMKSPRKFKSDKEGDVR